MSTYTGVLNKIKDLVEFTDLDKPFVYCDDEGRDIMDPEYGLGNPESKASILILYIYSLEPGIYADLNKACRDRIMTWLDMFGPFSYAIYATLNGGEFNRKDKVAPGQRFHNTEKDKVHKTLGCFNSSFCVFRGVSLKREIIN